MRISRLYVSQTPEPGATLSISGQPAHYVTHVLRLRSGAPLVVFGNGREHEATLRDVRRAEVTIEVGSALPGMQESSLDITLLQGIARSDRMDLILQKSVELGVNHIQPLWMKRSQGKISGERLQKRNRHWQGVITSACEQCGRSSLPELLPPDQYGAKIHAGSLDGLTLMLQPDSIKSLRNLQMTGGRICLLVGPEGGLTADEQELALNAGFTGIRLGQRIMRTETAAIAALAGIQTLWGDFR